MGVDRMGHTPRLLGMTMRNLSLSILTVQFSTFILLLHYSRVMPTPDGHRYLPSTAVFLVEALKLAFCLTISLYEVSLSMPRSMPATSLFNALGAAVFGGDSWKMALPATLYTLANSLQYLAISNLHPSTFHVLYQFKIFVTAIFSVTMLRRIITARQWLSLLLLMIGVAIVLLPKDASTALTLSHHTRVHLPRSLGLRTPDHLTKRSATYEGITEDEMALDDPEMDTSTGLLAVLAVCTFSGFAGVYFEKVIKEAPKPTSLWIRNVQLSLYSLFPAFFIGIIFLNGEDVAKYGFFAGYNWVVVLSIVIQTFGGIVAAFCIFYADNISKNFAISISMVLSSLASFLFFEFSMSQNFLIGASVVLLATWLYNTEDARAPRPPTVKLNDDEKLSPDGLGGMNDMSIQIPKTPLSQAETALATSRPGSPNRKKRKNEGPGYFTKLDD